MPDNPFKVDDRVFIFNDPTPYYITFISKHGICSLSNKSGGIRLFGKFWGNLSFTQIMPTHIKDGLPLSEDNRKYRNAKISIGDTDVIVEPQMALEINLEKNNPHV